MIPTVSNSHLIVTTAVFSTCGMGIIVFSIAAILSLPKQLVTVYLGVIIKETADGPESTREKIISDTVLAVSFLVTLGAAWWIYAKMAKAKPEVLRERRRQRARKEFEVGGAMYNQSTQHLTSTARVDAEAQSVFNPNDSEEDVYPPSRNAPYGAVPNSSEYALNAPVSVQPQRWDTYGRAIPVLDANSRGRDSADVIGWEPRADGGTTVPSPHSYPSGYAGTLPPAHPAVPYPPTSQTQSQQAPSNSYLPPSGAPPAPQSNPQSYASDYHDPYASPPQQQPPMAPVSASATSSPPSGSSTPYYSTRGQSQSPIPPSSAPEVTSTQPTQPTIPASVPRYQLHDGPAPSIMSEAPTYRTFEPPTDSPLPPRIPPPPGSQPSPH